MMPSRPLRLSESLSDAQAVTGLQKLRELQLSSNYMYINLTSIAADFPNVTSLELQNNVATYSGSVSVCDRGMQNLTQLDLSFNELTMSKLSFQMIEYCEHLQLLNLSWNNLDSDFGISLTGTKNLLIIDLSSNNIRSLTPQFGAELDKHSNYEPLMLDISNNPLSCSCSPSDLNFIHWLDKKRKMDIKNLKSLVCTGTKGVQTLIHVKYDNLKNGCLHIVPIVTGIGVSLGVVLFSAIIACVYRKRYKIEYKIFTFTNWLEHMLPHSVTSNENTDSVHYDYDAFVSYSSEDRFWVHDVLMKTLEETYGFKLFIHYRDILPGENLQNALIEGIRSSREIILVMSKNFLESEYCNLEMEESVSVVRERNTRQAVILLGTMPSQITENSLAADIMENHCYLQWKVFEERMENSLELQSNKETYERKLFWVNLVNHLYGKRSVCYFCCRSLTHIDVRDYAQ